MSRQTGDVSGHGDDTVFELTGQDEDANETIRKFLSLDDTDKRLVKAMIAELYLIERRET